MTGRTAFAALATFLLAHIQATAEEFRLTSKDGVEIRGDVDRGAGQPAVAVIFVPGTGLFDRDAELGASGTPRDLVFKDLAQRMAARGVATVRFDVRGVRHGMPKDQKLDRALLAGRTTHNMRDDLATIYEWTRSLDGVGARCAAFFAHSEGILHVARLAELELPPPTLIIGMGVPMVSPAHIIRWQFAERDAYSLELMDADRDGRVTDEEVHANWRRTPSAFIGTVEPFIHPSGVWTPDDIAQVRTLQTELYENNKRESLARADSDPYPDADTPWGSYQWWKAWYLDEQPVAARLAQWGAPVSLHYGDKDSQIVGAEQIATASDIMKPEQFKARIHPDRGHTLGEDVLIGPVDEAIADMIADEAAAISASCQ